MNLSPCTLLQQITITSLVENSDDHKIKNLTITNYPLQNSRSFASTIFTMIKCMCAFSVGFKVPGNSHTLTPPTAWHWEFLLVLSS